jgi:putative ABC transport system permease protein
MILASDVIAKLPEYATLKAMGYSNRFLGVTLLQQSIVLAIGAFVPAAVVSLVLYEITGFFAGVPIIMTWTRIAVVAALSTIMCTAAGLIAVRKLSKAEPASLF